MTVATRTDTLLSVNNVNLSYGTNAVLRDVNFTVQDLVIPGRITGQTIGLLGPSGIGKTTLLRIIAGLQKPTSGQVLIDREQRSVRSGDVGVVSQNYLVYRNRTVISNLVVASKMAKDKPSEATATQRSVDILNDFGLLDKAHLYPCQLSGGQRQRVAIAQQILASGDFLVFDEPTAGLDPISKTKTCGLISKLAHRSETETLIICSHDIPSVVTVCDTVLMMGRTTGLPGANIVAELDMISRGLALNGGGIEEVRHKPEFSNTVEELQDMFTKL